MKLLFPMTKTKFILIYLTVCIVAGLAFYGTFIEKAAAAGLGAFMCWWPGYLLFKGEFWTAAFICWWGSCYFLHKMFTIFFG